MAVAEAIRGAPAVTTESVACAHCSLPVPPGTIEPGDVEAFCCAGCRAAWHILHDGGLAQYYRLGERRETAVITSGRSFEEFDHPAFRALYTRGLPGGATETDLTLEGIHCASCVWLVERTPLLVPGMLRAELDLPRARMRVAWDGTRTTLAAIARTLDALGYRPHPFRGGRADAIRRAEDRAMLVRIGVAGAIAVNVMLAALALYSGGFGGIDAEYQHYFRWVSLLLTAPALLFPGRVFFRGAWAALRTRSLHMDVPIAVALAAGFGRGAANTITDHGPVYFDGVAALIFLLLVGRFLQQRAQRAAADSAELLHSLAPATARVAEGNGVRDIPVEALLPGMTIDLRAGDTLAADGVVEWGESDLDVSLLTGESRPVRVSPGSPVFAGTLNRRAALRVRVEAAGETTRLARIVAAVEAGARRRAPVVQLADRMAGGFVAVVLALAVATFLYWLRRDSAVAVDNAIALLIVTCPCALALATPLAITAAIGRAARAGILIKGGETLERLATPGRLMLDKTGTVTSGRNTLVRWCGPEWAKPLVLAVERHSSHPVATALLAAWPDVDSATATDVVSVPGGGVTGVVNGRQVVVGSPAFVGAHIGRVGQLGRGKVPSGAQSAPGTFPRPNCPTLPDQEALTPVHVAVDGVPVAEAAFGDPVRHEAAAALARLRALGWRPELLSGDDPAVVAAVGASLGFAREECRGGASPEDKLRAIEAESRLGPVVMVGDGVNDAAAIARADVGIAVRGGAEASLAVADVYLAGRGLDGLVALSEGAARTLRVIRRNIAFSLAYNLIGAGLAMAGLIHPLLAALLMPASSLTVVIASWRSRTFDEVIP